MVTDEAIRALRPRERRIKRCRSGRKEESYRDKTCRFDASRQRTHTQYFSVVSPTLYIYRASFYFCIKCETFILFLSKGGFF